MDDSVLNESQQVQNSSRIVGQQNEIGGEVSGLELKRPRKVKDFTVLANLVELAQHCIPKCDQKW